MPKKLSTSKFTCVTTEHGPFIYIYIHTIYTYDLPLISLLKMGFSHSKLFWFSVENLHWDVPEAVTGEPEELSHEAQAKPLR